ncbi:response regulator transcription factor [Anatilimnocola floriformis]|uniref:response regulator transcription factor n=1 Tax=Anatilimnocola floriformis TaxID=2948575 RepID=UPI0020C2CB55|nr:response regulator [Anatilimnocola floriformis]
MSNNMLTFAATSPIVARGNSCVHIVDDDDHFRDALALLLEASGYEAATYRSAEHFLSLYHPRDIECLLLDLRMPGLSGIEMQPELTQRHIHLPVIVISAFAETPSVVQAIRNGAVDFVEKPIEEAVLIEKVNRALIADRRKKADKGDLHIRLHRLSEREIQVMNGFLEARNTFEIARDLGISPKTVEKHRLRIFEKLDVSSVPELMCLMSKHDQP